MRAIVVLVNRGTGKFAVQTDDGRCAVFSQFGGVSVAKGQVLAGPVLQRGVRRLRAERETVEALGDSGPVALAVARDWVQGASRPAVDPQPLLLQRTFGERQGQMKALVA